KALTALAGELDVAEQDHDRPSTATEHWLAAAWSEVLGIPKDQIGRRDHFFDLGGTSLSALKLAITLDRAVSFKDLTGTPIPRDAAEAEAVFRRLASLMTEKEAFAPRRRYSRDVYSSSKWPPNQPMCMHHELSYVLEFPCLMLFACLIAPTDGGATPVADSPTV